MPSDAVVVDELVKRYPKSPVAAVDGMSFAVGRGEVFGLLGPNGAGKTTTIGVLTTRVRPTSGRAFVAGVDVVADPVGARRHLAVVPQRNNLDRSLSIRQNLLFHAAYHGVPQGERERRATELLEQFGLGERGSEKVDMFSGGQMQRVMIARALMHAPDVLFLDEPTTGLDPAARLFVWDRVRELQDSGVTVVLTTHDMDEASELASRVAIVDHGQVLALDTPEALTKSLPGSATLEVAVTPLLGGEADALVRALEELPSVERVERVETVVAGAGHDHPRAQQATSLPPRTAGAIPAAALDDEVATGRRLRLYLEGDAPANVAPVAERVVTHGASITDIRIGTPSLEDVFIHLTGRSLR
ncbi:MAG: transporter related protein [Acidimicrobiaceae bacterium]|nr:transporter related protein [Acidimicrobiaceae bacterium]